MNLSSVLITSLLAGAAGAIAGILLAINQGSKSRDKMARKRKMYNDYLLDNFCDHADTVTHPFEGVEV